MALTVHIPSKTEKSFFTLFASGCVVHKQTVRGRGTWLLLDGIAALFYTYPHCRRAYIVRPLNELRYYPAFHLPNVEQKVGVLFRARGRQIDLLRKALFFLAEINGNDIFLYDTFFWQKISCLIEGCKGRYSPALKSNIAALHDAHFSGSKRISQPR
jgi:hypothetical protein